MTGERQEKSNRTAEVREGEIPRDAATSSALTPAPETGKGSLQFVDSPVHKDKPCPMSAEAQMEELRRAREELQDLRKKYATLYDAAPVGCLTFDETGLVLEANLTATEQMGIDRSLLLDKPFGDYVEPESRETFFQHLRAVFRSGARHTCEIKLSIGNDPCFQVMLHSLTVSDMNGRTVCRTSLTDVSEHCREQERLRRSRQELKQSVESHATELVEINKRLQLEIEERKRTEEKLRESEQRSRLYIETMNEGFAIRDGSGAISYVNQRLCEMTGYSREELVGRQVDELFDVLTDVSRTAVQTQMERRKRGRSGSYEISGRRKDGRPFSAIVSGMPIFGSHGEVVGSFAVIMDISARKKMEGALRESEERYRTLIRQVPVGIFQTDAQGDCLFVNEQWSLLTGLSPGEAHGRGWVGALHPDDRERVIREWYEFSTSGGRFALEYRFLTPDGTVNWVSGSATALLDDNGETVGYLGTVTDITERHLAEDSLRLSQAKLQHLTSQLITAQESERRRISKELHDELGQALSSLKLQVISVENSLGATQPELRSECQEMRNYIDRVIENVRRLSRDLSPLILEDLGFSSALQWLIEDFRKRTRITCRANIQPVDDLLAPQVQVILYRIFQECLANIAKHAQATQVAVSAVSNGSHVDFCVEDNGRGFDLNGFSMQNVSQRGMGLATMDERVRMLGGAIEIFTRENSGTRIVIKVPHSRKGQ